MGKTNKNKKKISGSEKTAAKTEKKLNAKRKRELQAIGEDDIEQIVANIEREEARRYQVTETVIGQPTRRANFTLTAHPHKDELIMLGGEFHDGQKTIVYGDMLFYNLSKREWTVVKAPGAPPPRCGHQAVATPTNKGELWVFGGEYSSPSESQFYHYKDLWVYRLLEKKWQKITAPGGPSPRSGHRMVHIKKQLIVFGGFHDNLGSYKYFNDVHVFNLTTYTWHKIEPAGIPPLPRSGCIALATPDDKLLVYGGYSKEQIKKDVDKGHTHTDMFLLTPDKNGLKWKWTSQKASGIKFSPRCGMAGILTHPGVAYTFGGVYDEEVNDENIDSIFYNDMMMLDLTKYRWYSVNLSGKKEGATKRRRRKLKDNGDAEADDEDMEKNSGDDTTDDECSDNGKDAEASNAAAPVQSVTTYEDDIFTVTVGPGQSQSSKEVTSSSGEKLFYPSPRINPGLAFKNNTLYLYGGIVEHQDRQYTLHDFYSLDCSKLDEWKIIVPDDLSTHTWFESSSSSSDSSSDEEYNSDDDSD